MSRTRLQYLTHIVGYSKAKARAILHEVARCDKLTMREAREYGRMQFGYTAKLHRAQRRKHQIFKSWEV